MQSFSELTLSPSIARGIADLGFQKPSPIQAQALPILLGPATDFLGLAATGTGKTAAYLIPLLEALDTDKKFVQCLILCPTRELALQVSGQIDLLGVHKRVRSVPVYGGSSYSDQIRGLRLGAQVVVGTPGRIVDHLERGTLRLEGVTTIVLDEADEMISMGFKEELDKVLSSISREQSKIWLFSATMSREVRRVADKFLKDPKMVQVNQSTMLSATVKQVFYMTKEMNKPEVLCKLIDAADDFYGLVFCQTKALVIDLTTYLHQRGYKVDSLHGDKDQNSRERTMKAFRERAVTILVGTDVASRGIDVKDITHVINYSLPRELDSYVHRIGRTARSGKAGIAMSLVTPSHTRLITQIERMTKSQMIEGRIPSQREIGAKKIAQILPKFDQQKGYQRAMDLLDDNWMSTLATMTPEEVAARFIALMLPDIFSEIDRPKITSPREVTRATTGPVPREATRAYGHEPREATRAHGSAPREATRAQGPAAANRHVVTPRSTTARPSSPYGEKTGKNRAERRAAMAELKKGSGREAGHAAPRRSKGESHPS